MTPQVRTKKGNFTPLPFRACLISGLNYQLKAIRRVLEDHTILSGSDLPFNSITADLDAAP